MIIYNNRDSGSRSLLHDSTSPIDSSLLYPNWSQQPRDSRSPSPANVSEEEEVKLKPGQLGRHTLQ